MGAPSLTGWNLDGCPEGTILILARRLEAEWRMLPGVRDAPCAEDLRSVDAVAPDGDPAYRIENLCLQTDAFRKMHLEVAWVSVDSRCSTTSSTPGRVPAPVYAADLVAFAVATRRIADACPVTADLSLPEPYVQTAARLRADMLDACPAIEPRPLPEWGEAILSPEACVCVGPPKEDYPEQSQAVAFAEYAAELHAKHLQLVAETLERPFVAGEEHGGSARAIAAQVRFCRSSSTIRRVGCWSDPWKRPTERT